MNGFILLLIMAVGMLTPADDDKITYPEVVYRMMDLKRLALLPEEGETSGMFSSYDRRSAWSDSLDRYVNWEANNDGFSPQYIRLEGENMVLAEMEGPGAIVRIWSASPGEGHVKIYIDGKETPVLDMPFIDYFSTEKIPAYGYPQLVYETAARGFNNYVPITFSKSIKIVGEPKWGQYYHFNYITFPDDKQAEIFKPSPDQVSKEALQVVNTFFADSLGTPLINNPRLNVIRDVVTLQPGQEKTVVEISGNRAVTDFKIKLPQEMRDREIMRKTVLSIFWDNEKEPSVWSPLGDFFGSAPAYNEYRSLPMGMKEDGVMYSYWYMPFSEQAKFRIKNNNPVPVDLEIEVVHEENPIREAEFGYFHAKWHRDIFPVDTMRWPDWTLLKTDGTGRFVGTFLSVWNPKGGSCRQYGGEGHHWWGEGDEKFFVDDEKFPSTFGTGTEDYFGYAWCIPNFFEHAFHSQNYTEDNMGYQSLNRWQIIDNVPFQQSFDAYLEKYFPNEWPTQYASVVYWYLSEGGEDPVGQTPADELYGYETDYQVYRQPDVYEGENMEITENTGGWGSTDVFADERIYDRVSGHKVLSWFSDNKKKSQLEVVFDATETGDRNVYANVVKSNQGGQFEVELNNTALNQIDLYKETEVPAAERIFLGKVNLRKGSQELQFNTVGEKQGQNRLQLDYLEFEPVN